jgi:hypothetical protein
MSRSNLRTPWPIHFKFHRVIGIDGLTVCILFGEISIFHSRVMGLYSSNCRQFFVCRAENWEPLVQFTSSFAQLLELIVLRSVYFLVKFQFFIQELLERKSLQMLYECWRRLFIKLCHEKLIDFYTSKFTICTNYVRQTTQKVNKHWHGRKGWEKESNTVKGAT